MIIKKILFITLSNIGDVILTLPALDYLKNNFPGAKITVFTGKRPKEIFENNPAIDKLIVYDRGLKLREKIGLFDNLRKENFDLVIDLRNSFLSAILPAKYKTSPFLRFPAGLRHMSKRHLYKTQAAAGSAGYQAALDIPKNSLYIKPEDEEYINGVLKENGISGEDKIIVIAPGARSHIKRWPADNFLELIPALVEEFKVRIVLSGDKQDIPITEYIRERSKYPVLDLAGQTGITELACLLKSAACVITNDSAVLHLSSYVDAPVVALFGPTDEKKYGPWSKVNYAVRKDIFCRPCGKAQCGFGALKCMQLIKAEDVLIQVRRILIPRTDGSTASFDKLRTSLTIGAERSRSAGNPACPAGRREPRTEYKRILIVRTDRIGDVLLSTPVIRALRENYPSAYIAMMVSPCAKDIVEGNPYLDEVIIYDKDGKHKSWVSSIRFARNLREKKFDLALILHPANRAHLVTFFAGIPRRVGYDRKSGFLLTDKLPHTKQLGEKHESEYALDLARYLGVEPKDTAPFMPVKPESEKWADSLFNQEGIEDSDRLLAIHPGASCPSKIWPNERFAEAADKLITRYGFKALVLAGPKDTGLAQNVIRHMRHRGINLAGKTSVSQLAGILKKCELFISNDSGPVHIAAAVGTPVISIFGRAQKGLSPKRWGPLGLKDMFLHKTAGCIECLAHNCVKEFACLKAVTVEDVLNAADSILETGNEQRI